MFNTKIQWSDSTVNFWTGCQKVSEGCKYCYMYRGKERNGEDPSIVQRVGNSSFTAPLYWEEPRKIFTCSYSDFFISDGDQWRDEAWAVIRETPQHSWQILTKRPERISECLPADWGQYGYSNTWLGVSIANENEKHRLGTLQRIKSPESRFLTFLSIEPLISPVDFLNCDEKLRKDFSNINWVIIGGESGNSYGKYRYRECQLEWIEGIVEQCKEFEIPVFVKQLGTHLAKQMVLKDWVGGEPMEWPENLKIRQFPVTNN